MNTARTFDAFLRERFLPLAEQNHTRLLKLIAGVSIIALLLSPLIIFAPILVYTQYAHTKLQAVFLLMAAFTANVLFIEFAFSAFRQATHFLENPQPSP